MTLHERLQELFQNVFNDDTLRLSDETSINDIAGWDSVTHINLMFSIEQTFDVEFTGNELGELKTVGELKRALSAKQQ